jgi:LmbE family N-acetylglucosaminyl deacetylase
VNVLVIAPHPDDEAIGCGGALCLHAGRGDRVTTVFLTSGELGLKHLGRDEAWRIREEEAVLASRVLATLPPVFLRRPEWFVGDDLEGTLAALLPIVDQYRPDIVYVPHGSDDHPDHRAAHDLVRMTPRLGDGPVVRTFEVWTPLGSYDHVEDVSAVMERKLCAIRCYASQLGHFRYDVAIEGLNRYRGCLAARCEYAEVFRVIISEGSFSGWVA